MYFQTQCVEHFVKAQFLQLHVKSGFLWSFFDLLIAKPLTFPTFSLNGPDHIPGLSLLTRWNLPPAALTCRSLWADVHVGCCLSPFVDLYLSSLLITESAPCKQKLSLPYSQALGRLVAPANKAAVTQYMWWWNTSSQLKTDSSLHYVFYGVFFYGLRLH